MTLQPKYTYEMAFFQYRKKFDRVASSAGLPVSWGCQVICPTRTKNLSPPTVFELHGSNFTFMFLDILSRSSSPRICDFLPITTFYNKLYFKNFHFFGVLKCRYTFFIFQSATGKKSKIRHLEDLGNRYRKINVEFEPCSSKTVGGDRF